ncbi:MAG: hypothetical protein OXJ52_05955 [Oligoflexia bacterium]|nr:hypothetical protein [Oligoflexia bacterium]
MNLQLFKEKNLVKTVICFSLFFFFGAYSFAGLAETLCDCEEIVKTKKCDNPDCVKICNLKNPLMDISSFFVETCLGKGSDYVVSKEDVVATEALSLIEKSKQTIMEIIEKSKESLKKNCPQCQKLYKISARFGFKPKKKTCPEEYLKVHSYKESKQMDQKKGACNLDELLNYLENYAIFLVTKNKQYTPKGISSADKKLMESRSKKLWAVCPSKCSFLTNYVTTINSEECKGEVDIKIGCTHKVETKWFKPIYDVDIDYKPDLKCKGSQPT